MSELITSFKFPGGSNLEISRGDLTDEKVDAIVNAANSMLRHGGGIAAAISSRGGPVVQRESDDWIRQHGPVSHAEPAYTSPGLLPCRYIIHAVGPIWGEGGEDNKLHEAVSGCLRLAEKLHLSSIALPAISTGIFGFPKDRAARIFFAAISHYFTENPQSSLQLVRLTLYDAPTLNAFLDAFKNWVQETNTRAAA